MNYPELRMLVLQQGLGSLSVRCQVMVESVCLRSVSPGEVAKYAMFIRAKVVLFEFLKV
jgi:hypothetical protein